MTTKDHVAVTAVGVVFGIALSRIGFSSWDEVHHMFTFQDFRLVLVFAVAVALLFVSWVIIRRLDDPRWAPRLYHKGTIPGGVLFGMGWALSGACPSIAMVALGEGQLGALVTLAGIFAGNWAYGVLQNRWLHWAAASCADD